LYRIFPVKDYLNYLDWRKEKGVIFSFMASDWIRINEGKSLED